jgi:hypothetical protein
VFDCREAGLLARDDDAGFRFDVGNLVVAGIGPLAQALVRTSGLHGGGLAVTNVDGWELERHPLSWPDDEFFLSPPGQTILWQPPGDAMKLTKLAGFSSEVRAFGFSPTGKTFIIATAADISVFGR